LKFQTKAWKSEPPVQREEGEEVRSWIEVKKRLPIESGWVMTFEKATSGGVRVRWFQVNSGKFIQPRMTKDFGEMDCTYFVTHWRSIPPVPKEL
jgi:hypothetical protein